MLIAFATIITYAIITWSSVDYVLFPTNHLSACKLQAVRDLNSEFLNAHKHTYTRTHTDTHTYHTAGANELFEIVSANVLLGFGLD